MKDTQTGKMKCWEYFVCKKKECPVYKAKNIKCWLISGTQCRNEIQGKFLEKMEMCLNCRVFKNNVDFKEMKKACKVVHAQFKEYKKIVREQDKEIESLSLELALSLSEVFEALKKISSGDPSVRIREDSKYELIAKLKHLINMTAQNTGEIVDQAHEIAIDLAEHFDVLHRVSQGNLNARVRGFSQVELLESLKKITNNMIQKIQIREKERNQAEKVLREMETLESSLLTAIPHAVIGIEERRIIFANPSVEYVFGWKPEELIRKSTRHLYRSEKEYEEIGRLFYPILKKKNTYSHEFICRRKDGREIVCNVSASVIGEKLTKKRIVVMYEDISKRKMAEEQIVQSRREWEEIVQAIGHPTIIMDAKHNILSVNRATLETLGIDYEDAIKGKKCYEVFHAAGAPQAGCPVEKMLRSGLIETVEMEMETLAGTFLVSCTPMLDDKGNVHKIIHIATEITERKRAEAALKESEQKLRNIVEHSNEMFYIHDTKHRLHYISPQSFYMLGYTPDEMLIEWTNLITENPINKTGIAITEKALRTGKKQRPYLLELFKRDGSRVLLEVDESPLKDDEGTVIGMIGAARDVTEMKRVEKNLLKSEEKYRTLVETMSEGIGVQDEQGIVTYVNERFCRMIGYTHDELIGRRVEAFLDRDNLQRYREEINERKKGGESSYEQVWLKKDGQKLFTIISPKIIYDETGRFRGSFAVITDVTDLKHAQEEKTKLQTQLLHSQKLEAVGQLAGGIAHDFNNILTAIITYGHFLKMKIDDEHLRNYADHILSLSEKAANLTSSLLAFSRKQIINLKPVDLNEIIRSVEKILFRIIGEDIVLQSVLSGEDLLPSSPEEKSMEGIHVMADPGQIEQVLMNLATNARDAMPKGGMLSIETRIVELDSKFIKSRGYGKEGRYALLSIRDTGTGIDEKNRERIFEPFFTTKEVGKGTGLGLAMVYGITKQHDGFVDVSSKKGKGTTFEIYLPLIQSEIESAKPEVLVQVQGGNETILLAEDDQDVRSSTREILEKFGYTVIEAINGEEAVHSFMENKAVIQFVILDMVMPKKGGKEVYEEIRRINPQIKVLFSSGYTEDDKIIKGVPGRGYDVIQKPVHPSILLKKIRNILNRGEKD
jgi:PAS domain S-box-containing protein